MDTDRDTKDRGAATATAREDATDKAKDADRPEPDWTPTPLPPKPRKTTWEEYRDRVRGWEAHNPLIVHFSDEELHHQWESLGWVAPESVHGVMRARRDWLEQNRPDEWRRLIREQELMWHLKCREIMYWDLWERLMDENYKAMYRKYPDYADMYNIGIPFARQAATEEAMRRVIFSD